MPQERRSKYGAVRTTRDGIEFHSAKEAKRYGELKLLQKAGEITGLMLQPRYGLYVRPFMRDSVDFAELISCGDYIGDFQYYRGNEKIVEDVKGMKTPVYRLKKRIIEALYGITITEL